MKPEEFVDRLGREKASAILRTNDQEKAALAMEAAMRGGFTILEFTLTIPGVYELVQDFSKREGVVVGTGTVMHAEDVRRSVDAGAQFVVSPVVDEVMIEAATDLGVASMPGTHTPTEMLRAHRAGADLCKLFPAAAGGPVWVKSVLGPMPYLKIVPTNGVDEHNATEWLRAGCYGVGFVNPLFVPEDIEAGRWEELEARAARCIAAVNSV
jgi:2-dehydro-3-deoxyphosphogluconate aldolase/(4S)-4-hydroxy-2-oxoglutarate aldolase